MKVYAFYIVAVLLGVSIVAFFGGVMWMMQKVGTDPEYSLKNPGAPLYKYKRQMLYALGAWLSVAILASTLAWLSDPDTMAQVMGR